MKEIRYEIGNLNLNFLRPWTCGLNLSIVQEEIQETFRETSFNEFVGSNPTNKLSSIVNVTNS